MALKDALHFFNKIQTDDAFRSSFELAECLSEEALIRFATGKGFVFTSEEFSSAFDKNYDMRWMLMVGMNII